MAHETARVEAFSDAVFAIAMTLLVLDLQAPAAAVGSAELARELARVARLSRVGHELRDDPDHVDLAPP